MTILIGSTDADLLIGTDLDDITGLGGNDTVDGGACSDVAVYTGIATDYRIGYLNNAWIIKDLDTSDGDDGSDTLTNIETLRFADREYGLAVPEDISNVGEFQVNSFTRYAQEDVGIASLADGGFVVTWQSQGQDGNEYEYGVYAQRYAADGRPAGGEFRVNSQTDGEQANPCVTGLTAGGFVVAWESSADIYGQRYAADGSPAGAEFPISAYGTDGLFNPNVAALADGGFVAIWTSADHKICGQRYAADGSPLGKAFQVNDATPGDQGQANVASLADGGFVVTWESYAHEPPVSSNVHGQRYSADGSRMGGEFQVNTHVASYDGAWPSITGLGDGGFIISWVSDGQDGSEEGISGQRYAADGTPAGGEFQVNSYTAGYQGLPSLSGLADGGFVVTWTSLDQDGNSYGVYGQRYSADGSRLGSEFLVNNHTASAQGDWSSVADLADGGFVITWESYGQDGSNYGVYAQRYAADGTPWQSSVMGTDADDTFRSLGNLTFHGGAGNDRYLIRGNDRVIEQAGEGRDKVITPDSHTLADQVEILTLTATLSVDGTGNARANRILGNDGDNTLDGLQGDDRVFGGLGNDRLLGRAGNDSLDGGDGLDVLRGALGNDTLTGGAGNDVFVFNKPPSASDNVDTLTDFATAVDRIRLDDDIFTALTGQVALLPGQFVAGDGLSSAQDADDRIVYDTTSGALYYDADGGGGVEAVAFAILGSDSHPPLAYLDFVVAA